MVSEPNILLSPEKIKPSFPDWEIQGVFNPGGARDKKGNVILYARVAESPKQKNKNTVACPVIISETEYHASYETVNKRLIAHRDGNLLFLKNKTCKLTTLSHLRKIVLDETGFAVESIDSLPTFYGIPGESEYGVEDPRIVRVGATYLMTYVGVSEKNGISTYLAESRDLTNWKRKGILFQEQNKDVVLFPEKINGFYVALNRPENSFAFSKPHIWISYSRDLIFWGKEQSLLDVRRNSWDEERNGAGCPPIQTSKGWLVIYHGVSKKEGYSAGAMLLDLKNPQKILALSSPRAPLLTPAHLWEKTGFVNKVVFPTAVILSRNAKEVLIYSGAGDRYITVRKIPLDAIFKHLEWNNV